MATCPVQWRTVRKGGDPKTDQATKGTHNSRAGIPKRLRPNCHQRSTLKPAWTASVRKRAGAQRHHCTKGRDPRTPASWRHLLLRVVAATSVAADPSDTTLRRRTTFSGTIWVDGRTHQLSRRTTGQSRRGQLYQLFRRRRFLPLCSIPSLGFADDSTFSSAVVFQFQIASFDTHSVRENAAQFLFWCPWSCGGTR